MLVSTSCVMSGHAQDEKDSRYLGKAWLVGKLKDIQFGYYTVSNSLRIGER